LWDLLHRGIEPLGFIHDEILFLVSDQGGHVDLAVVEERESTMSQAMAKVTGAVPVACESTLSTCWSKRAARIVQDGKMFAWSSGAKASLR
jgi:hypothetical protein